MHVHPHGEVAFDLHHALIQLAVVRELLAAAELEVLAGGLFNPARLEVRLDRLEEHVRAAVDAVGYRP